uniref:Uncharacterized protein n=1 Tax=Panagrolaimus superbus TaxID=310955 RepID=A0A914ZHQ6_9BILA
MFENCDENQILEWIDVVFGVKQNILILLKDEEIYKCIEEVQRRQPNIDFSLIDKEIRAIFRSLFVDCLNFKGIIEIYRILLYCETHTKCSTVYWKAVTELWKKLGNENSLNLTKNKKATIYPEHESLLELVKSYEECQCEIVKDLIKNLFKTSVTVVCKCKTNSEKIEARGYTIYLSTINDKIEELMNDEIREIEINAQEDIIFDQDIYLPGKNLILIAKNRLVFLNPQVCNLSGKMAENDILISPQIGRKMGEDGLDGKDGKAGQSSGNILISAKTIEGKDNLKISLNGGNGSDGQDGGDGVDGEDGKGKDFDTVFGWAYTFSKGIKYLTLGAVPRMLDNTLREKVDKSGANHITSDSAYYLLTHTIELYGGSDGKLGGRGGINGCGGEGGKKGSYDILINGERCDNIFEICAQNGKDGRRGKPGQNGRMGLDGWDIALTAKAFGDRQEFGKMKNEKLRIIYSDYRSPDSVYVKEKDKGIGSQCYAKIISSPCERKILRDQQVEVKTDSERSAEACATKSKPIDIEAISQQQLTTAQVINVENEEEQNANSEIERYHETGRIMDFYKPLEIDNYVFKQRHHTPIIIDEKLEGSSPFWTLTLN